MMCKHPRNEYRNTSKQYRNTLEQGIQKYPRAECTDTPSKEFRNTPASMYLSTRVTPN